MGSGTSSSTDQSAEASAEASTGASPSTSQSCAGDAAASVPAGPRRTTYRRADETGTLDNVERWFTQFGWETFELKGGEIFHNAWIIGLFGMVALTGALVLLATLFNLVSDIVGGVRMTVLEEEVVERTISSTRRYVVSLACCISAISKPSPAACTTPDGRKIQSPTWGKIW